MNLGGAIHLGTRYLRHQRRKAALLIAAITLSLTLPLAISLVVRAAEDHLRARSLATPLLLCAPGSPLELVFNAVYFSEPGVATLPVGEAHNAGRDGLAEIIPLYARYHARGFPIVGTTLDYFSFRGATIDRGRLFTRLGDCVLGASVARRLRLGPGDTIVSTPEQVFDLAGVYPLKMRIAGILAPTGSPDDNAVFVDLKTTWIIEGIAHGHQDARQAGDDTVLDKTGDNIALNAAIVEYTEITPENAASFHFHGDTADFPVSGAIVRPADSKSATILLGRFLGENKKAQLVRPDDVMEELFATVFRIRDFVVAALAAVGLMAALIATLVFLLSNRLRAREFESLANIGADAASVRILILFEALFVLLASLLLAAHLLLLLNLSLPKLLPLFTT